MWKLSPVVHNLLFPKHPFRANETVVFAAGFFLVPNSAPLLSASLLLPHSSLMKALGQLLLTALAVTLTLISSSTHTYAAPGDHTACHAVAA